MNHLILLDLSFFICKMELNQLILKTYCNSKMLRVYGGNDQASVISINITPLDLWKMFISQSVWISSATNHLQPTRRLGFHSFIKALFISKCAELCLFNVFG